MRKCFSLEVTCILSLIDVRNYVGILLKSGGFSFVLTDQPKDMARKDTMNTSSAWSLLCPWSQRYASLLKKKKKKSSRLVIYYLGYRVIWLCPGKLQVHPTASKYHCPEGAERLVAQTVCAGAETCVPGTRLWSLVRRVRCWAGNQGKGMTKVFTRLESFIW